MSHDLLVQMAYCLFKFGKRHVVVENLAGGFEPVSKGEMFWVISPVLRPTIERRRSVGQRSFKLHTHKKKEIKEKTNIITLTNLKRLPMRSQGIIK